MSACNFEFEFSVTGQALVEEVGRRVREAGGSFTGSPSAGDFALPTPIGTFKGSYTISEQTIYLEVTDKPFFVPCSAIETKLSQYVEEART